LHIDVGTWIAHYGYVGVFFILLFEMIGIPFPAETTLTVSGFEWTKGVFHLIPLLASAIAGNVLGSSIAYGIGRFLGRPVILKFGRFIGITAQKLDKADQKFVKYRNGIVIVSKFIAGIRVLVPYLAGINRMPFTLFSLFNTISAILWATIFIILGRSAGIVWDKYHRILHAWLLPSVIILVVLIGASFYIRRRSRKNGKEPQ
jgi:membrane protein DedA with SNARE-associated domain